jgi:hypothetical protein
VPIRMSVGEVASASKRVSVTLRPALGGGELQGLQQMKGCRWAIHRQCLLAWRDGRFCNQRRNLSRLRAQQPML